MKSKTFLILLVAAGVLATLSFFRFGGEDQKTKNQMGEKLFADFPVNEVAKIGIIDTENQVTLVKGKAVWQVEERDGYPANFNDLRDLVVKLSRLKIGRTFTGSEESITRLSLASPKIDDAKGKGKQITLWNGSGNTLADVIIGDNRKTESGANGGQYLKINERDDVFLVDDGFPFLKTSPSEWLEKEILNIKADEIVSVTCYAKDETAPAYTLSRPQKGDPAQLNPTPNDREANSSKIDQVFDALAPLTLEDVKTVDKEMPDAFSRTRLVYRLYDGREITVFPEAGEDETYTVQLTAKEVEPKMDAVQEKGSGDAPAEEKASHAEEKKQETKSAQQIEEEVRSWIFIVKKWQFDSLITEPDLLLEEVDKEGKES
jgi:hypothetical protein